MQPFRVLSVRLDEGVLDLEFDGDDFEMEDERNWTETGFKSYSRPLSRPWPIRADAGATMRQSLTVTYRGVVRPAPDITPAFTVGGSVPGQLPLFGHAVPEQGASPSDAEVRLLRLARPDFVQADLQFEHVDDDHLTRVTSTMDALDRPLLASLHLGKDSKVELARFIEWVHANESPLQAVVVLASAAASALREGTPATLIRAALPSLRSSLPGVPIAVGSDRFLSEVIRTRPSTHGADAIAFGISPAGHTDEDWAIVDSLPAQRDAVRTLRADLGETPIYAGPVTLQTRFGSWPRERFDQQALPLQVDLRQRALLAAAWTLGSVRELTLANVALVTYFETIGWRGLLERESGSRLPAFPSEPLEAFPLLHVFADLAEVRDAPLLAARTSGPLTGLAFGTGNASTVLLANLEPATIEVRVGPLVGRSIRARLLDSHSLARARREPERFRASARAIDIADGYATVRLARYAYARLTVDESRIGPGSVGVRPSRSCPSQHLGHARAYRRAIVASATAPMRRPPRNSSWTYVGSPNIRMPANPTPTVSAPKNVPTMWNWPSRRPPNRGSKPRRRRAGIHRQPQPDRCRVVRRAACPPVRRTSRRSRRPAS